MPWTGNASLYCSRICYFNQVRLGAFWSQVRRGEGCWIWQGSLDADGYGTVGNDRAHRRSWEIANGPIPDGKWVLHHCDNPPCVRPDHLFIGDATANMKDRFAKGRYSVGEAHAMALVNEDAVREIRATYVPRKNGGLMAISKRFGVAPSTVHAIVTRKIWKHI